MAANVQLRSSPPLLHADAANRPTVDLAHGFLEMRLPQHSTTAAGTVIDMQLFSQAD